MGDHRILPIDERWKPLVLPHKISLLSFLWLLQDKAQPSIIALVLDAGKASSSTLEAHPPGLTQADAVERTIGACRQSLGQHCLDVLGNPAHPESFDRLMQGCLRKAILFSQGCESARSFLLVGARDGTRRLPGRICSHLAQAFVAFRENGIVDLAASFQVGTQSASLSSAPTLLAPLAFPNKERHFIPWMNHGGFHARFFCNKQQC